jgi:DNA-binding NarL/FixJ family response regulator
VPSILLVEDHATVSRMISRLLRERGQMEVWGIAETAEAALEMLATAAGNGRSLPDLVLADISLPGMSGTEMVGKLTQRYPDLPALMVSAAYYADNVQRALNNGARGYVVKGNPAAILEGIRQVLDGELYLSQEARNALKGSRKSDAS